MKLKRASLILDIAAVLLVLYVLYELGRVGWPW
jgi:hypothetical protein